MVSERTWRAQPPIRTHLLITLSLLAVLGLCGCKGGTSVEGRVDASGGEASGPSGRGGQGGEIFVAITDAAASDLGIEVRSGGQANVDFEVLALPAADPGANALVVDDEVFVSSVELTEPQAGAPYLLKGNESLFVSDGDTNVGNEPPITGLVIEPGGRLVLPHHSIHESDPVRVVFSGDIVNDGEITTFNLPNEGRGHFGLVSEAGGYRGRGDLLAQGLGAGQAGGVIELSVFADGFNDGDWLAFGGGDGGEGGSITFISSGRTGSPAWSFENTGRLDARGGDDGRAFSVGGEGGRVRLEVAGRLFHSGTIDASGGEGDVEGGAGDRIEVATGRGDFVSVGDVISAGGLARSGLGGQGGDVDVSADGGSFRSRGDLLAQGGGSIEGTGGGGGFINVSVQVELAVPGPDLRLVGPIEVSGRVLATGGDAPLTGGNGGGIRFQVREFVGPNERQHIALLGQRVLSAAGGDGHDGGGEGGTVKLDTDAGGNDLLSPVVVEPLVDVSGGDAGLDEPGLDGGGGGMATFRGLIIDRGDVDVSAGEGTLFASDGEVFDIFP